MLVWIAPVLITSQRSFSLTFKQESSLNYNQKITSNLASINFKTQKQAKKNSKTASAPSIPIEVHTQAQYAEAWKSIRNKITNLYYNRKAKATEIKKYLDDAKPQVLAAKNDHEFRVAIKAMIHRFGDSHFDFYDKHDQEFYLFDALARGNQALKMPTIGAYFVPTHVTIDGKVQKAWQIDMVLNNSQADEKKLLPGDIILDADGKAFSPIDSFAGTIDKPVKLKVLRKLPNNESKEIEISIIPQSENAINEFLFATIQSEKVILYKGKKFGYIHVWTLANPQFASALNSAVLANLYNTDGLIFDIRGGFGGRPENVLNPFFLPPIDFKWQGPGYHFIQHTGYDKPIVLLTDHIARSAKEMVCEMFKLSKRAVLVGQTTAGNVLGTTPMKINNWAYLEMPIVNVFVDGYHLEKVGVSPDVYVPPGFNSKGEDRTLIVGEKTLDQMVLNKAANASHR